LEDLGLRKGVDLPSGGTTGAVTVENLVSTNVGIALLRLPTQLGPWLTRFARTLGGSEGVPDDLESERAPLPAPVVVAPDAGLTNALLVGDFTQKMGGRKRVATATVAFRFDHGLAKFDRLIRPEMEARNFKYSLALCSARWHRPENAGVTPAMVNSWVRAGLAEIWNHSKDHGSGDGTDAGWKAAIADGLTELETQIPAAAGRIFGFAPPGSKGADFGGFIGGKTLNEFYATEGGRYLLSTHAVVSGYLYQRRVQDGTVRQGGCHITVDAYSFEQVQKHVEQAQAGNTGLQIMLHPGRLDTAGYMTTATFVSILDYVMAETNVERLQVVSPYEQLLTDVVG
jgi:hypothetical protein